VKNAPKTLFTAAFAAFFVSLAAIFASCASRAVIQGEEFYVMGMAYFDKGDKTKAEEWLKKAANVKKTSPAANYQLGRLFFDQSRFTEAAQRFSSVVKQDRENVMALRSLAYTYIKLGDAKRALEYYRRVTDLVPENADDGYNYSLVLYSLKRYADAEAVLLSYDYNLPDNYTSLLLLARCQKELGKVEAIDNYDTYLKNPSRPIAADALIHYEYAQTLEKADFFARAAEEYKAAAKGLPVTEAAVLKCDASYAAARLLLVHDSENEEGLALLKEAINTGFADEEALKELQTEKTLSPAAKTEIKFLLDNNMTYPEPEKTEEASDSPETADTKEKAADGNVSTN